MKTLLAAFALLAAYATTAHADIAVYNIVCANNDFIQIRADQAIQEIESISMNDADTVLTGIQHKVRNGQAIAIYQFSSEGQKSGSYSLDVGSSAEAMKLYRNDQQITTCTLNP